MRPTLAVVLDLDVVRRARPEVLAGGDRLEAPVRWVHAMELADVARLLHGGELVLSTGIALPDDPALLAAYVADLAAAGVSGLAVELGRRYDRLPDPLVEAARAHAVPLIAFHREVPFVEITETVHAMIIDAQLAELRASERMHETFTELSVAGAPPEEIVRQAALLAGRPVILEDLSHRVLACSAAGADPGRLLDGFEQRARAVSGPRRTFYDEPTGWLVTTVGARGEDWGRVILGCDAPPTGPDTVLIERAASTLALGRLLTRQQESLERQAHRTLISAIVDSAHADPGEAAARARALGVPVTRRQLIAAIARLRDAGPGISAHARMAEVTEALADACREARIPALVGSLDDVRAGVLLSLPLRADADEVLTALSARLRQRLVHRLRPAAAEQHGLPRDQPGQPRPQPGAGLAGGGRRAVRARRRHTHREPAGRAPGLSRGSPGRGPGHRPSRGPAVLPAAGPATARPAAPAPRRRPAADVRRTGTGPAAGQRRRPRHRADAVPGRLPGGRRQQGAGRAARAPGPAHLLPAARADRAHPRR